MFQKLSNWVNEHPSLFALTLVTTVFIWATLSFTAVVNRQEDESDKRRKAFCGLVYLFDQSIKLRGSETLGQLEPPYNQWKKDVEATDCPKKPDLKTIPSTTMKI